MSDREDNWSQDNYGNEDDDFDKDYSFDGGSDCSYDAAVKKEEDLGQAQSDVDNRDSSNSEDEEDYLNLSDLEEEEQAKKVQNLLQEPETKNKQRITPPYLSKYEKAAVLGKRAMQISRNAPIYVYLSEGEKKQLTPLDIAERELLENKLPYIVRRPLPNGEYEEWKLEELKA